MGHIYLSSLLALLACFGSCTDVLVLLEGAQTQRLENSLFFAFLEESGCSLKLTNPREETKLVDVDLLLVFSPRSGLSVAAVLEWLHSGGSALIVADKDYETPFQELVGGCGIELHLQDSTIVDHFQRKRSGRLSLSPIETINMVPGMLGTELPSDPILLTGVGTSILSQNVSFPILTAPETAFSLLPSGNAANTAVGTDIKIISAFANEAGARAVVSGSMDFFSNQNLEKKSSNFALIKNLVNWLLNRRGLVRVKEMTDKKLHGNHQEAYIIRDSLVFSAVLEENLGEMWVPFASDKVQMELLLNDEPSIRMRMYHSGNGCYEITFVAPDVPGNYTWRVQFREAGYYLAQTPIIRTTLREKTYSEEQWLYLADLPYYSAFVTVLLSTILVFSFSA